MKYALTHAHVLDGKLDENGQMPCRYGTVLVEDGVFTSICKKVRITPDYEVIDLQGGYLMPGLINLHCHLPLSGRPSKPKEKPTDYKKLFDMLSKRRLIMAAYRKLQEKNVRDLVYSGATTVRTVGGVLDFDRTLRDRVKEGKLDGPRMLVCNSAISVPGGHFAGSIATEAHNPQEAVHQVRVLSETKPDWIKLMVTGGVMDASAEGEPGALRMEPAIIKAACDEAHRLGYRVAAHVESPAGVRAALENGVDSIEHGACLDEELVQLFKEKNAMLVTTVSPAVPMALCSEEQNVTNDYGRKNAKVVLNGILECARTCMAEGIPVGLGTDSGCPHTMQYNTWRELLLWTQQLGVTPACALNAATENNAKLLGLQDVTGTVEVGKRADFIVSKENPLENLRTLADLQLVCANGKVLKKRKLRKNEEVEKLLDTVM